jgi:hypothetical protein
VKHHANSVSLNAELAGNRPIAQTIQTSQAEYLSFSRRQLTKRQSQLFRQFIGCEMLLRARIIIHNISAL